MRVLSSFFVVLLLPAAESADQLKAPEISFSTIRSGNYAGAVPDAGLVRILDWNIDRGERLEQIAKGLAGQTPAIYLLQEVDFNSSRSRRLDVADVLARRLGMNFVFAPAFEELGQGTEESPAWQGQATLSSFPIRNARILRFKRQTAFWAPQPWLPSRVSILQRRLGGRIGLVSEIDVHGSTLVVYNLHLESRGLGYTRYAQLAETLADARRYNREVPVVLAGDLNTKYAISRFSHLLEKNGFRDCLTGQGGRTHRIIGRLDWIFVRGDVGCTSGVVDREVRGSDHFAVRGVLQLGTGSR